MGLITKSKLRELRINFERQKGSITFSSTDNKVTVLNNIPSTHSVFLSHKHDEVEELKDAIALLRKYGVNVYIDHLDDEMPKQTSGETAKKIKQKIESNKKFVLLATEKAIASKWCNWELGFGDAHKYIGNIALLVVKDDHVTWSGNEYLQIYPIIVLNDNFSNEYYEVKCPDGSTKELSIWLNS